MVTHSSILAWRIPWMGVLVGYSPWDHKELDMIEQLTLPTLYKAEKGLISVLRLFHFCHQQIG